MPALQRGDEDECLAGIRRILERGAGVGYSEDVVAGAVAIQAGDLHKARALQELLGRRNAGTNISVKVAADFKRQARIAVLDLRNTCSVADHDRVLHLERSARAEQRFKKESGLLGVNRRCAAMRVQNDVAREAAECVGCRNLEDWFR